MQGSFMNFENHQLNIMSQADPRSLLLLPCEVGQRESILKSDSGIGPLSFG